MDEDRFGRYDQCLDEVLDLLGLVAPPRPTADEFSDCRIRRTWQARTAWMIFQETRPPLPEALFEPLVRAGVYEPDPSHTLRHIRPAVAAFGRRRVRTRLLAHIRTGTAYEIGGAADAWYCSWWGSKVDEDPCHDLQQELQATALQAFVTNPDLRVRYCLISHLNLRADESPEELRPLIAEVLRIAYARSDGMLAGRIRENR